MSVARKPLALAAGALIAVSAAALPATRAQQPAARSAADTIVIDDAHLDWIERSEVAALIEGNVESIELDLGKMVRKGAPIGKLNSRKAELTVAKAKVAAESNGAKEKAEAQYDNAVSALARIERMIRKSGGSIVPKEDEDKARAEMKVTQAMIKEAEENQALAKAELDLAKNQLDEHTIRAPFTGMVIKRMKHPGESVNAREPVIELGNLDKLRVFAFVPLEEMSRVSEGTVVELQPRVNGKGGRMPVEEKRIRGKVTFVDPQVQAQGEKAVRIYADFDNSSRDLRAGMMGSLTIYLDAPGAARGGQPSARLAPEPVVPASATAPSGGTDLPPLPR